MIHTCAFRYHPDPVSTGSARLGTSPCEVCGTAGTLQYYGPIFGRRAESLCLACISSGAASQALARPDGPGEFTDVGWGVPDDVPKSVRDEISLRTPGFYAWQESRWLYHCGDAAAYRGRAGWKELEDDPGAKAALRAEALEFQWEERDIDPWMRRLSVDGDLTAYLFECLHCGIHLAYSDAS